MKKFNKKGFTIVELVIVIAVIAILAAVLIPTFSGIITKANQSAVQQEAAAAYKEVYALDLSDGKLDGDDHGVAITGVAIEDLKDDAVLEYVVDDANGTFTFKYTRNGYIAEYSGAEWSVGDATAEGEGAGADESEEQV